MSWQLSLILSSVFTAGLMVGNIKDWRWWVLSVVASGVLTIVAVARLGLA